MHFRPPGIRTTSTSAQSYVASNEERNGPARAGNGELPREESMAPKLSLLLPVYNEEKHLEDLCASVTRSDYDFELIVVNDHSSDGTLELAHQLADADGRIKVFENFGDRGIAPTVNVAYASSTGEFVSMLGGDDTVKGNYFTELDRHLSRFDGSSDRAAVFTKLESVSDDSNFDGIVIPRGDRGNRSGPCMVISRALADEIYPLPRGLFQEDLWISFLAENMAEHVCEITTPTYNYRIHAGNTNPRHLEWSAFDEFMGKYNTTYEVLLERKGNDLPEAARERLDLMITLSQHRNEGETLKILAKRDVPLVIRLRFAANSNRWLHGARTRFYRTFSGW